MKNDLITELDTISVLENDAKNNCSPLVGRLVVGDCSPLMGRLVILDDQVPTWQSHYGATLIKPVYLPGFKNTPYILTRHKQIQVMTTLSI